MKKMSIAEQTLQKQIRLCEEREAILQRDSDAIQHQIEAIRIMRFDMEREQHRLRNARLDAAERQKAPKGQPKDRSDA